jgi:hypothetical protein
MRYVERKPSGIDAFFRCFLQDLPIDEAAQYIPGDAVLVVVRDDREGALGIDLPGDPSSHRLDGPPACADASAGRTALQGLPVTCVELLAVEHGDHNDPRTSKALRLRDPVERITLARRVQERS